MSREVIEEKKRLKIQYIQVLKNKKRRKINRERVCMCVGITLPIFNISDCHLAAPIQNLSDVIGLISRCDVPHLYHEIMIFIIVDRIMRFIWELIFPHSLGGFDYLTRSVSGSRKKNSYKLVEEKSLVSETHCIDFMYIYRDDEKDSSLFRNKGHQIEIIFFLKMEK